MAENIAGKSLAQWLGEQPDLKSVIDKREILWLNPRYDGLAGSVSKADVMEAEARLRRFAPYMAAAFPETREAQGIIESPIYQVPYMKKFLEQISGLPIPGRLLMKADSELPVSGSIKARGGIYEVMKTAEHLAIRQGMLNESDDYSVLTSNRFHRFFSEYSLAVGSTGNLGLSIGIVGAALGFRTTVHMSHDAQQWKKDLLRQRGAEVREYQADYSTAVETGRRQASEDAHCHFIDDEHSKDLFFGYATAGCRLRRQLGTAGIQVDADHPLFVYLPCGVGGAPAGVTFGLKTTFGAHVHAFFVEPTHAPCFLIGLMSGLHDRVSVQDFGLDNQTAADGLAVPRASAFAGKAAGGLISGCMTIDDERLFQYLKGLADTEGHWIEPSATAGLIGPQFLTSTETGRRYLSEHHLGGKLTGATHLFWATGGGMVPKKIRTAYYEKAAQIK